MARLLIDLDCLADFEAGAAATLGMPAQDFRELHGDAVLWKHLSLAADFYARLAWRLGGKTLWREVNEKSTWAGPPPMILSAVPGEWAGGQKREWCGIKLGMGVPVLLGSFVEKHAYCCAGDILIDVSDRARLDWTTAGGRFILHTTAAASLEALAALVQADASEGTTA